MAEPVGIRWGRHKYRARAVWFNGQFCAGGSLCRRMSYTCMYQSWSHISQPSHSGNTFSGLFWFFLNFFLPQHPSATLPGLLVVAVGLLMNMRSALFISPRTTTIPCHARADSLRSVTPKPGFGVWLRVTVPTSEGSSSER